MRRRRPRNLRQDRSRRPTPPIKLSHWGPRSAFVSHIRSRTSSFAHRRPLGLENCHRRAHSTGPKLAIEALPPGHRVQDDLLVPLGPLEEPRHDARSKALALMARQHGDVAQIGAVTPVRADSARPNQLPVFEREAAEHAVGEDKLLIRGLLVSERGGPVERRQLLPRRWSPFGAGLAHSACGKPARRRDFDARDPAGNGVTDGVGMILLQVVQARWQLHDVAMRERCSEALGKVR